MKTKEQTVLHIAQNYFGDELGAWLYENNKIVPVNADKSPATKDWKSFGHFNYNYIPVPVALAVIPNDRIAVLDIDDPSELIGQPNVASTKGGHYWFVPEKDQTYNKTRWPGRADLLLNNYAIFYGPGKEFNHSDLMAWDELTSSFPFVISSSPSSLLNELEGRTGKMNYEDELSRRSVKKNCNGSSYVDVVKGLGIEVEVRRIMEGYATQMQKVSEGQRNSRLFRLALEAQRLGADTEDLAEAAIASGLVPDEVYNTIGSAEARFEMDAGVSVLDRVQVWRDQIEHTTSLSPKVMRVVDHVFERAVACNTYKPQISQKGFSVTSAINQGYIGTTLNTNLVKLGFLEKESRPGFYLSDSGQRLNHCNNYYLCIGGTRIEDNLPLVDDLIGFGQSDD